MHKFMNIDQFPFGTSAEFNVLIEIPAGSENKYEYDPALKAIKLDYVFRDGFHFPFNYGSIVRTRGGDGDHLDAVVLSTAPIQNGVLVTVKPLGYLQLKDQGEQDDKIICVPVVDPLATQWQDIEDLSESDRQQIADFFKGVGVQKNKRMDIEGFFNKTAAIKIIEESKL